MRNITVIVEFTEESYFARIKSSVSIRIADIRTRARYRSVIGIGCKPLNPVIRSAKSNFHKDWVHAVS